MVAGGPASAARNSNGMPGGAAGTVLLLGGRLSQNAPQRVMSTAPLLGAYAAVSVAMDGASAQLLKIPIHGADVGIEVVRCRILEPIPTHGKLHAAEYDPRLGFGLGAPIVFGKTILAPNAAVESVHGTETCGGAGGGACSRDGYYVFYIGYKAVYNVVDLVSYEMKVKVLSGGERGRLALCKLLLKPINFLVMDEPTNHLDMNSKDVLKKSLLSFDGTLLVVSHDREFLEGLVTKTVEFRDQRVKTLLGGIDYYLEQRKLEDMRAVEAKSATEKKSKKAQKKDDGQLGYKERKQLEKDIRSLSRKLADVEAEIENLEGTLEDWDVKLADADSYMELMKDPDFYPKYEKKKEELASKMNLWEDIQIEKDQLEQQLPS